jgi:ATP-dependent helicase/nuclease subunit B
MKNTNQFITSLAAICEQEKLIEKWLLAPTRRIGNQWAEQVARAGTAAVNLRVTTPLALALQLLSAAGKDITLLPYQAHELMVDRLWCGLKDSQKKPYLATVAVSPGFLSQLASTISDLRTSGVTAGQMDTDLFEVGAKGLEVAALYSAYCSELEKRNLYDSARVLGEAASLGAKLAEALVLVPAFMHLAGLEGRFIHSLGEGRVRTVEAESAEDLPDLATGGRGLEVSFAAGLGETVEVRQVFRRCLAEDIPLDQVEIIYSDQDTYLPLLYEESVRLTREHVPDISDPPVTFADGIPTRFTRPGRALMAWVDWIREGFPQPLLVSMLRGGLLKTGDKVTAARMARLLRSLPVGSGQERYLPVLASRIRKVEQEVASVTDIPEEERRDRGLDLAALEELHRVTAGLLATCPAPGAPVDQVFGKAQEFLARLCRATNRWDNYALESFAGRTAEFVRWYLAADEPCILDPYDRLRTMAHEERVGGSGPRPGCLHASRLSGGGNTGRPHTFIVGLDDSRHPGAGLQDPILLDRERSSISEELPTAAGRLTRRQEELRGMLARLRGQVVASWPCRDLADDRELFPAGLLLELARLVTGEPDAQGERLLDLAGVPAAFSPADDESCINETEWWLQRLTSGDIPQGAPGTVLAAFPHLAAGSAALKGRLDTSLTPFDGLVELDSRHDPLAADGPAMSATRLETIGRCPLAYFYSYLLGVRPPEDPGAEREVWLEPIYFGSLLHDVLHRFMELMMEKGETPCEADHMDIMEEVVIEESQRYKEKYPTPDSTLYAEQVEHLLDAARVFLQDEEEAAGSAEPYLLEQAVGLDREEDPVSLELPGGVTIRSHGRIDRIDRLPGAKERFRITDYKSGSAYRYDLNDPFRQGRTVQAALYIKLAEKLLREKVGPDAEVESFRYYFPASRSVDEPVLWESPELLHGDEILAHLVQVAAGGTFNPSEEKKDCRFCDHQEACGDFEALTAAAAGKLEHGEDSRLAAFRKLRGVNNE